MKRKVLLMGPNATGKTSMRSIIFANYLARDTHRLGPTVEMEQTQVRFLGNLVLNLWDCGGQHTFIESYLKKQREYVFSNVAVLIYVLDVEVLTRNDEKRKDDMEYLQSCIEAIRQFSPNAKGFVLIHKMDLVPENMRDLVFQEKQKEVTEYTAGTDVTCFPTSIWNDSLYYAWSTIVHSLIPSIETVQAHLRSLGDGCDADEVVLFERSTFLVVSRENLKANAAAIAPKDEQDQTNLMKDAAHFERVSNVFKQFKVSCNKMKASFHSIQVGNSEYTAFLDRYTENTYVLVVVRDRGVLPSTVWANIASSRQYFLDQLRDLSSAGGDDAGGMINVL